MGFGADYLNVSAGTNAAYGQRLNNAQAMRNDQTEQDKLDELRAKRDMEARQRQILAESPMPQLNKYTPVPGQLPDADVAGAAGAGGAGAAGANSPIGRQTLAGPTSPVNGVAAQPATPTWGGRSGGAQGDQQVMAPNPKGAWGGRTEQKPTNWQAKIGEEQARLNAIRRAQGFTDTYDFMAASPSESFGNRLPQLASESEARLAALRKTADAAARGGAQGGNPSTIPGAPAVQPGSFVDRIRQAESAGNPNAVGRYIPGQGTAKGDMQVMDATNLNPGFGVVPARDNSPAERSRVGRDYAQALLQRYGNEAEAAAAYNWGPGNYDQWKAAGGDASKMPAETRAYVAKVTGGAPQGSAQTASAAQAPAQVRVGATYMPNVSPAFAQRELSDMEAHFNMLSRMAQVERDPAKALEARANLMALSGAYTEKQLQQTARTGDLAGMVQFANLFGHKIGAANAGNGMVVLVDNGQQSQPMSQKDAVTYLYQGISPLVQQMNQNLAAKAQEAMLKARGEIAVENVKGANARELAQIHGNNAQALEIQKTLAQMGMDANSFTYTTNTLTGATIAHAKYGKAAFELVPGQVVDGVQLASTMRQIQ